jgi:hypothetical protein
MRFLLVLAGLWLAPLAHGAGLAGTYAMEGQAGTIIAKIEAKGTVLTGTIDFGGQVTINLVGAAKGNSGRGTASSRDGTGEFEAIVEGDILNLTISQQDGPNQRAATLPLQLQRIKAGVAAKPAPSAPRDGAGDPRLVGNWVHQDVIVSGDASMASEEFLVFRADGTYAYGKGSAVAGGADWSFDGGNGGEHERGRWRARDGVLFVLGQNGQWARIGTYGMTDDASTMRITYDQGGKKLWSRR